LLISSGSTVRFSKTSVLSGRGLLSDETGGDEFSDDGAFAHDGTTNKKLELQTKETLRAEYKVLTFSIIDNVSLAGSISIFVSTTPGVHQSRMCIYCKLVFRQILGHVASLNMTAKFIKDCFQTIFIDFI